MRPTFLFIAFSVATMSAASGAGLGTVQLDSGMISGISGTSAEVQVYKGIPYAAPPVGNLRWREPQPAAHWDGVRKADQFGAMCMQPAFRGAGPSAKPPNTSEDCLFLNVWTAATSASDRRPVMVWIHPGGYQTGSGSTPGFDGEGAGEEGRGAGHHQLPAGRVRILLASGVDQGIRASRVGKLRADGSGGGAAVGAEEYRCDSAAIRNA